jgi:hypothetical protein
MATFTDAKKTQVVVAVSLLSSCAAIALKMIYCFFHCVFFGQKYAFFRYSLSVSRKLSKCGGRVL